MKNQETLKRPITSFIILTNVIFWPLFLLTGVTIMLGLPNIVFSSMLAIASWSSTFAFIILFKRIYPGQSLLEFIKSRFKEKIKLPVLLATISIPTIIFLVMTFIFYLESGNLASIFSVSTIGMIVYNFFINIIAGPTGEELGWRGYVQVELQKKYSTLKSAIIVGFWWGIWHAPIWFTAGLGMFGTIKHGLFFVLGTTAMSIVMASLYNLNNNLLLVIILHQLINFFLTLFGGNPTTIVIYNTIAYWIVAIILIIINPKKCLYGKK